MNTKLKIGVNDTLLEIIQQIKLTPEVNINLIFTSNNRIAQSIISLRIIALRADILGKKITFECTSNKLLQNAVLAGWNVNQKVRKKLNEPQSLTFWQGLKRKFEAEIFEENLAQNPKLLKKIGIKALLSILILLFISSSYVVYLAVPDATVYITPNLSIKTIKNNFYFAVKKSGLVAKIDSKELLNNPDVNDKIVKLPLKKTIKKVKKNTDEVPLAAKKKINISNLSQPIISTTLELIPVNIDIKTILKLPATGKTSLGKRAYGQVLIKSSANFKFRFRPGTRLQTNIGLVFRTTKWVNILPKETVKVAVIADNEDINGDLIGIRGNIKSGIKMVLPALRFNSDKIRAISSNDFSGGVSLFQSYVSDEDVTTARIKLKNKLLALQKNEFKKYFINHFPTRSGIALFKAYQKYIWRTEFKNIKINAAVGAKLKKFSATGELSIKAYAIDEDLIYAALAKFAKSRISENEIFLKLQKGSLEYENLIDWDEVKNTLKLTVSARSIYSFSIFQNPNFIINLRNKIRGLRKQKAEFQVINRLEVADVKIVLFPFWLDKLPDIAKNINFKLVR